MTWLLPLITVATLLVASLRSLVDWLNLRRSRTSTLPAEFDGVFSPGKFRESKAYLAAQTKERLVQRGVGTLLGLTFLWLGGFGALDSFARGFTESPILTAVIYFAALGVLSEILSLPFSYYSTFVIEERFGFNRSSLGTFVGDTIKGWVLGIVLGLPILAGLVWFFLATGTYAWLWAWGFLAVMQLVILFLAPVLLMPLFNKFTPLPEGDLKSSIESYAARVQFRLQGIFTMDGSKRSAKANAFFTGLGRFRRIVLFDTLVNQHTTKELVAVLAHEVGHFKKGHIPRMLAASLISSLVLFYLLSLVLNAPGATEAVGFPQHSVHAGLTVAFLVYGPLSLALGFLTQWLSRKHEFEADRYAVETTGEAESLVAALKRLSAESLSNLDPHPWKVLLEYSHPPVIQRIRAMRAARG